MSLAVRLLLALGTVALFVTALVGYAARDVSRREVERGFEQRMTAATSGVNDELVWEADALAQLIAPLCKHDTFVDRTLLDLERSNGDVEQLPIGLRTLVADQQKALRLDELVLVTGSGQVIGASDARRLGTRDRSLKNRLAETDGKPRMVWRNGRARLQAHCKKTRGGTTLGVVAARAVGPILERIGAAYEVTLSLESSKLPRPDGPKAFVRKLKIDEIPGLVVTASISRQPLYEALAQIDSSIFLTGAIAVLLSVALAMFVARSLSQPIVELAHETREVVLGEPRPVRARGGRELKQLANSFNKTLGELVAMRKRLARSERIAARREVARQVAHEIKNPLAPIRAAIETLRRLRARDSPQFDEYFDEATRTVLEEVHRIKNIVSEFTKFARLPPPKFERVDIEELAAGVVGLHDAKDVAAGAHVHLSSSPVALLMADHDQLVQVLTNLVQNGIEAATPVTDHPEVLVELSMLNDRELCIGVTDNGPGLDERAEDRLFEPYFSTKSEGTGLGLSIVQTIVHEHGGEILVMSDEGGGARFEVVLPISGPPLLEKAPHSTGDERDSSKGTTEEA
jgi:two-component system nitrogen regulation sensor histidine kinase NtrY